MDADLKYVRRICSGLRKRQPARIAYDAVRRDSLAFKVRTEAYRMKRFVRYGSRRPRKLKLKKPDAKPSLVTPLKNIAALAGFKIKTWNPRKGITYKAGINYVFPKDYAAPKDYFGSGSSKYLGTFDNFSFETKPGGYSDEPGEKAAEEKEKTEEYAIAKPSEFEKAVQKEINDSYKQAG